MITFVQRPEDTKAALAAAEAARIAATPVDPRPVPERMASTMRELAFAGRTVERATLYLEGFSAAEIEEHWQEAAEIARRASIRRLEHS